jgi:hypothetical protein
MSVHLRDRVLTLRTASGRYPDPQSLDRWDTASRNRYDPACTVVVVPALPRTSALALVGYPRIELGLSCSQSKRIAIFLAPVKHAPTYVYSNT